MTEPTSKSVITEHAQTVEVSLAMFMWASALRGALSGSRKDARSAQCPTAVVGSHCEQLADRTDKRG